MQGLAGKQATPTLAEQIQVLAIRFARVSLFQSVKETQKHQLKNVNGNQEDDDEDDEDEPTASETTEQNKKTASGAYGICIVV